MTMRARLAARWVCAGVLVLWVSNGALGGESVADPAGIVVKPAVVDFGDVQSGVQLKHVVSVTNQGESPVRLGDIRSSCGCTAAILAIDDGQLAPGESASLEIRMSAYGTGGARLSRRISIAIDGERSLTIPVEAHVTDALKVTTRPHEAGGYAITVESTDRTAFQILGVSAPGEISTAGASAVRHEVVFGPEESARLKQSRSSIELILDHPTTPRFVVGLRSDPPMHVGPASRTPQANRSAALRVVPRRVAFSAASGDASVARIVLAGCPGGPPPLIRCVRAGVATEIVSARRSGDSWAVEIALTPDGLPVGRHQIPLEVVAGDRIGHVIAHVNVVKSQSEPGESK